MTFQKLQTPQRQKRTNKHTRLFTLCSAQFANSCNFKIALRKLEIARLPTNFKIKQTILKLYPDLNPKTLDVEYLTLSMKHLNDVNMLSLIVDACVSSSQIRNFSIDEEETACINNE